MEEKDIRSSEEEKSEEESQFDELDFIIKTNTPYDLFAFEKDLTDNQVNQVNNFIDQQIKRKVKNPESNQPQKDKSEAKLSASRRFGDRNASQIIFKAREENRRQS